MSEQVLVFPAQLLQLSAFAFEGIKTIEGVHPLLKVVLHPDNLSFMNRAAAEVDENFLQVIPYCVLRSPTGEIYHYRRTRKGGENRLHDKWSIGVGGHINSSDADQFSRPMYEAALHRELSEEVFLLDAEVGPPIALLYDPSDAVGRVHFGVVHFVDVGVSQLTLRDPALTDGYFIDPANFKGSETSFESWSQLIINSGILPS